MLCGDTAAEPLYLFINEHLMHPLDTGQAHWKSQPPITSSLHCISRAGAPPISTHRVRVPVGEGTAEPQDAGGVSSALLRRSRRSPVLAARLLAPSPRRLGLRLLGYGAFPALLDSRLRRRQTAPCTWAPQLSSPNGRLGGESARTFLALLPAAPPPASSAHRRAMRPNGDSQPLRAPPLKAHPPMSAWQGQNASCARLPVQAAGASRPGRPGRDRGTAARPARRLGTTSARGRAGGDGPERAPDTGRS